MQLLLEAQADDASRVNDQVDLKDLSGIHMEKTLTKEVND